MAPPGYRLCCGWCVHSALARVVQGDAIFVVDEAAFMQGLITVFTITLGMDLRRGYQHNRATAEVVTHTSAGIPPQAGGRVPARQGRGWASLTCRRTVRSHRGIAITTDLYVHLALVRLRVAAEL